MAKKLVILLATFSVLTPIVVHIAHTSWSAGTFVVNVFPIFGLLAFTLLWLHSMAGVFEEWLREHFDFDNFVHWTSIVIFVSIILHPLLLLILVKFNFNSIFRGNPQAITLAVVGLLLLLTYDIGKALRKHERSSKHWRAILIISNIGFILTFFHSLSLGSDLQEGPMRILWIFYGVTAILGIIYTYGIKKTTKIS